MNRNVVIRVLISPYLAIQFFTVVFALWKTRPTIGQARQTQNAFFPTWIDKKSNCIFL